MKGGDKPTVCDANVVLGYLPSDVKLGGAMTINRDAAVAAVQLYSVFRKVMTGSDSSVPAVS